MTTYKDRLTTAMQRSNAKPAALAAELGVSYQAVMKVLDGKTAYFDTPNNVRAARFLGVTSDWLATGYDAPGVAVAKGPSDQGKKIAELFDLLPNEPITRTVVHNQVTEAIMRALTNKPEPMQAGQQASTPVQSRT